MALSDGHYFLYMYIYLYIYIYIYTYVYEHVWLWGTIRKLLPTWGVRPETLSLAQVGRVADQQGSVLNIYRIKRSRGVFGAMHCIERTRMQHRELLALQAC